MLLSLLRLLAGVIAPSLTTITSELVSGHLGLAQHNFIILFLLNRLSLPPTAPSELSHILWGRILTHAGCSALKLLLLVPSPLVDLALSET